MLALNDEELEQGYVEANKAEIHGRHVPTCQLCMGIMYTLAQSGNGCMTSQDKFDVASDQIAKPKNGTQSSYLYAEILDLASNGQTAVCNSGSISLGRLLKNSNSGEAVFDFEGSPQAIETAVSMIQRVVGTTTTPTPCVPQESAAPRGHWSDGLAGPIGQDASALRRSRAAEATGWPSISEEIFFDVRAESLKLRKANGSHERF